MLEPVTADDETIRKAILAALEQDACVRDQFVNITVSQGVVHLWGAVQSEDEKDAAHLVAENCEGVRSVQDHLGVIPSELQAVMWAE